MNKSEKKVLCVGLCCLDIVMFCDSYPEEDSDQRCLSHFWQRGGNASNNSTIFSEFNIPCEILGTMSTDIGGQFMKKDFTKHNVTFQNCPFYDEYESPTSVIWINSQNGSRTIVHSNKGMPEVSFENFKQLNLSNYSWIHLEVRPQFEQLKYIIEYIRVYNNFKPANECLPISIEIEKPRPKLIECLSLGDMVFISKDFALACGYNDMTSAVQGLCHKLRPGAVIVCAWGEKGAAAKTSSGCVITSSAYEPTKIVNTLGAGDTFVAATIIGFLKGQDLSSAINTGCKVAGAKCGMQSTAGLSDLFPNLK